MALPASNPSSKKSLRPLLLPPPPAHLPPEPVDALRPLSLLLSQPYRPDAATDVIAPGLCSPSSTSPLSPGPPDRRQQQRRNASFCTLNPALSSAAILVGGMLFVTLVPSWIGFRVLNDISAGVPNSNLGLPPFWYLTLVGAFTSLAIGTAFGCVVGLRAARHSEETTSGLMFLMEDWARRAAVAGCLVMSMFALPVGMAMFRGPDASAYRAADGFVMEVVGLGIFCVLGVGGLSGYVLWYSVRGEWRRRRLMIGYKY